MVGCQWAQRVLLCRWGLQSGVRDVLEKPNPRRIVALLRSLPSSNVSWRHGERKDSQEQLLERLWFGLWLGLGALNPDKPLHLQRKVRGFRSNGPDISTLGIALRLWLDKGMCLVGHFFPCLFS